MRPTTSLEYIDKALVLVIERHKTTPELPVYKTLIDQLKYVRSAFDGNEPDKSMLHKLTIGAIGAKEFETTDDELAVALMDVHYITEQSANGLKIRLPGQQ